VGGWLEGTGAMPSKVAASADLQAQLHMQDEAAVALRQARAQMGALNFDRVESEPVIAGGNVQEIATRRSNRAAHLIEDFMIAANEVMAETLRAAGVPPFAASSERRSDGPHGRPRAAVGRHPSGHARFRRAQRFLARRKQADPLHFPDLSLSI